MKEKTLSKNMQNSSTNNFDNANASSNNTNNTSDDALSKIYSSKEVSLRQKDIQEKINLAYKSLSTNNLEQAKKQCLEIIKLSKDEFEAYNILSFIYNKNGEYHKAIKNLQTAIKLSPKNHIFHNNISNIYKNFGDFDNALVHLNQALELSPNYAEAYNNMGNIYYKQEQTIKAITFFEKALRIHPHYFAAHYNLANALVKEDRFTKAITHYKEALKLQPNNFEVKQNLALAYVEEGEYEDAIPLLKFVIEYYPYQYPELYIHLAEAYIDTGKIKFAIPILKKAIELLPKTDFLHHNLAICYLRTKLLDSSLKEFKLALKLNPNNQTAKHMIIALEQKQTPDNSPEEYVINLFDQYANYYTEHMKQTLKYKAPELMRQIAGKFINASSKAKKVLDLGCGTGLCGIYFSDLANVMVGVDLSKNMLLTAKQLKAYDILVQQNISTAIPGENLNYFDFILAADVFTYNGNLETIFQKCKSSLTKEGKFIFTIEKLTTSPSLLEKINNKICNKMNNKVIKNETINNIEEKKDEKENNNYKLQKTGRFAHSPEYISKLAKQCGFKISYNKDIMLRKEDHKPIDGMLYLLESLN